MYVLISLSASTLSQNNYIDLRKNGFNEIQSNTANLKNFVIVIYFTTENLKESVKSNVASPG